MGSTIFSDVLSTGPEGVVDSTEKSPAATEAGCAQLRSIPVDGKDIILCIKKFWVY